MSITLNDIRKLDNGARFFAAELHIHSYGGSADVKDPAMTVENIIEDSLRQGISIISITDHNSDKNVEKALEYAQTYAGQVLVIPGVEITTANGHLLAYFPPEKAERLRDLLGRIDIRGDYGERDSHTAMSMPDVIGETGRLGGICIAAHIDRTKTGFDAALAGYGNIKKDILASSGLYALEFDDANKVLHYSPDDEPTADGAERRKLLNARLQNSATAARFRLAGIQNSDAHSSADLTKKRGLTRLKMNELSFEGLRMALIDPEARVRIIAAIPPSFPRVLGMHVAGGFLNGEIFSFSDNLNTCIGGRGTGKSTSIRALAYGLGVRDELEEQDNCPDTVVVYCEDANGVMYRYERSRGFEPRVLAREDQSIKDVPNDSFRVEFFGQGDLAEVAKNPLKNAELLQEFLDRHVNIRDLYDRATGLLSELEQNSTQLIPHAISNIQLPSKIKSLQELDVKLKVAETGKVREIAAFQIRLAAEKNVATSLSGIAKQYITGVSLANFYRDYDKIESTAGELTNSQESKTQLQAAKSVINKANDYLRNLQADMNVGLKQLGSELQAALAPLQQHHTGYDAKIAERMAELRQKGLSGSLEDLNRLIHQRTTLAAEVAKLEAAVPFLNEFQTRRRQLLQDLADVRDQIMERRKAQLSGINKNLANIIKDYAVNLYYDPSGIMTEFKRFLTDVMHGTYCPEDVIDRVCATITPQELAAAVARSAPNDLANVCGIGQNWAQQVIAKFQNLSNMHALEVAWKPPKPVIKVLTKGTQPKQIPVNQLSDGQKHTILLTIAMLSESNLPLIIDQPEDDLDNAFIFSSVVSTLRKIKEQRQVILVTHNANIAVLGDSEMLFPMRRSGDQGTVFDRGSIDRTETKQAVQQILEGGELAFRRRKEIYGY